MSRIVSSLAKALSIAAPLLALTACPASDRSFPQPTPVPDDDAVITAARDQLTAAESKGWSPSDDSAFSARLAELSMPKRLELGQRLAREISLGKIALKEPAPHSDNRPPSPGTTSPASNASGTPGQGPATAKGVRENRPLAK